MQNSQRDVKEHEGIGLGKLAIAWCYLVGLSGPGLTNVIGAIRNKGAFNRTNRA